MPEKRSAVLAFVSVSLVFALGAAWGIVTSDTYALHLGINAGHDPLLDVFFKYATHFADGLVPTAIALLLLFKGDRRAFLMMALSTGISALLVQFLKHAVFGHHDRPIEHFDLLPGLHLVPGVDMNHHFSFPSGHSTTAFSMCFALAVIIGRKGPAALLAVTAAVLAFSRVYLSQHFTEDILAGAALGTLVAWLFHQWLYRSPFGKRSWMNGRMFARQK